MGGRCPILEPVKICVRLASRLTVPLRAIIENRANRFDSKEGPRLAEAEDDVRVLFVEDDPSVAQMYKLKLELDGYSVTVAPDGEEAVRLAIENPPDIVFLDIRLPKMDGLAVLEKLRQTERTSAVPVVILSNYSERELVEKGLKLGALEYLIKSQTTPAKLAGGVESWLKS
jgi:CheY-like chemotaxis protein